MKRLLYLCVCLMPLRSFADTVSTDEIFSSEPYIGALELSRSMKWDGYTVASTVFTADDETAVAENDSLIFICAQGGGDCDVRIPFLAQKQLSPTQSTYQVLTKDRHKVWLRSAADKATSMLTLATQTPDAEIAFRNPMPPIYTDASYRTLLNASALNVVPNQKLIDPLEVIPNTLKRQFPAKSLSKVQILFTALSFTHAEKTPYVRLSMDAVYDEYAFMYDFKIQPKDFKPIRVHIRDVWIPATDNAGRINFWLVQRSE